MSINPRLGPRVRTTDQGFTGSTGGSAAAGGQLPPASGLSGLMPGAHRCVSDAVGAAGASASGFGAIGSLIVSRRESGGAIGFGNITVGC